MPRPFFIAAALSLAVLVPPAAAQQRTANRVALEQYLDWEEVSAPQLSPDGTQIIFSRRWVDKMTDRWESSLWLMNADGSHQRSLTQGSDVNWSPDGKRIAYIARGEPNGQQIFVRWMDAEGAVTQISHLTDTPSGLEWSPDGKSIAFTMNVAIRDTFTIGMPTPPKGAKWTEPPKVVSRLNYRSDRVGYTDEAYRHIFVIPADGGTPRQLTSGDGNYSGADLLGGRQVDRLLVAPRAERGDGVPQVADLRAQRRDGRDQAAHARRRARATARRTRRTAS